MTVLGIKRKLCFFLVNKLLAGTRHFSQKRKILNWAGFKIGEGTKVVGPVYCTAELRIGRNCWIGRDFSVDGNGTVVIGDNCDLGPNVSFQVGGHQIGTSERRAGKGVIFQTVVGNGCWICANSTILGGVTVGDGCVVAACGCVAGDVPPNVLTGGVPARVIRHLEE